MTICSADRKLGFLVDFNKPQTSPDNFKSSEMSGKDEIYVFISSALKGDISAVEGFLEKWPKAINEKDLNTWTALMHAVWSSQEVIVASLIKRGANIREKDKWGRASWVLAKRRGNRSIIGMIEEALKKQ